MQAQPLLFAGAAGPDTPPEPSTPTGNASGTREWSSHSANCCTGCSHGCRYCYARELLLRWGFIERAEDWTREQVRQEVLARRVRPAGGVTMFPTTHDITPANLGPCLEYLGKLLAAGRRVLIVSKPHVEVIRSIIEQHGRFAGRVLFRFTIGAVSPAVLRFWEPGAPDLAERLDCLRLAFSRGWETSVSAEPLLEAERVEELVELVAPFVSDTIWIGKANDVRRRSAWSFRGMPQGDYEPELRHVEYGQTDEAVRRIYDQLRDHPLIRWKESYKRALGLPLADRPGMDI